MAGKGGKAGDWTCPGCGDHQFARNTQCRQCGMPKPENGGVDIWGMMAGMMDGWGGDDWGMDGWGGDDWGGKGGWDMGGGKGGKGGWDMDGWDQGGKGGKGDKGGKGGKGGKGAEPAVEVPEELPGGKYTQLLMKLLAAQASGDEAALAAMGNELVDVVGFGEDTAAKPPEQAAAAAPAPDADLGSAANELLKMFSGGGGDGGKGGGKGGGKAAKVVGPGPYAVNAGAKGKGKEWW